VMIPDAAVGLVELAKDGSVRLAVQTGSAQLASAGAKSAMTVAAGKELSIDPGGTVSGPRDVTDKRAFDLLRAGNEGK